MLNIEECKRLVDYGKKMGWITKKFNPVYQGTAIVKEPARGLVQCPVCGRLLMPYVLASESRFPRHNQTDGKGGYLCAGSGEDIPVTVSV